MIEINKEELYRLYIDKGMTSKQISLVFNCNPGTILRKLQKYNIKIRQSSNKPKYTKNDSYFSILNQHSNKDYWAGFIASDGNICYKKNNNALLQFNLQGSDINILDRFKSDIEYNGPIYTGISKKYNKTYEYCQLQINNATQIADDLYKYYNITKQKSLTLQPPPLENFISQLKFIIGVIDGDGSICLHNKNLFFNITGTKYLLDWTSNVLYSLEDSEKYKKMISFKPKNRNYYTISCSKNRCYNLLTTINNFITEHKLCVLKRKWLKIKEYENLIK